MRARTFKTRSAQSGITLVTTLIMLVGVMLLSLSASLISRGEFKLAGNLQFQAAALNAAEVSIAEAQNWLEVGTNFLSNDFQVRTNGPLYPIGYMAANALDPMTMTWSDATSIMTGAQDSQRYYIELLAERKKLLTSGLNVGGRTSSLCNQSNIYRIVAKGVSAGGSTRFVQSVFGVLNC